MEPQSTNGIFQNLKRDAFRFIVVGVICYATDLFVYQTLTQWLEMIPQIAHFISRLCGGLVSFTLNKFWTFRHIGRTTHTRTHFARYCKTWVGALLISEALLTLFNDVLKYDETLAKVLADMLTGLLSFAVQRHWTFR